MAETYQCAMCGGTFDKVPGADEKAIAEAKEHFGEISNDEAEIVCDDCYKQIDPAKHPEKVERANQLRAGAKTAAILGIVAGPGSLEAAIRHATQESGQDVEEMSPAKKKKLQEKLLEAWWKKPIDTNCTSTRQIDREDFIKQAQAELGKRFKGYTAGDFYAEGLTRRRFRSMARALAKKMWKEARLATAAKQSHV